MSEQQAAYGTSPNADQPRPGRPDLAAIRAREQAATPGPWRWRANLSVHHVWLGSLARLKSTVMNFHRWGMQEAQPHFNVGGIMRPPAYIVPEPHNAWDATGIDHPDARFIEHAREDIPALLAYCERLEAAVEESDNHSVIWSRGIATVAIEQRDAALARVGRLGAAGATLRAIVARSAAVANLPEERAAVAAWDAAVTEGWQG